MRLAPRTPPSGDNRCLFAFPSAGARAGRRAAGLTLLAGALVLLALAAAADSALGAPASCGLDPSSLLSAAQAPPCWRPYADTSPFNRPLPAHPRLDSQSSRIVARLLGFGPLQNILAGQAGSRADFARPIYFARGHDPLFRLRCGHRRCSLNGLRIRIPDRARPAGGDDAHMTVIEPASGWEYDLWRVRYKPRGGGTLTFSAGGRTRLDGAGLHSGAVAAGYGTAAGLIREEELAAGRIDHALFLAVKCDSGRHVYPAVKHGLPCRALGLSDRDAPAEGTRFALAMSDRQIAQLGVPRWKQTILRAMAHYGMIVGDTGGSWQLQWDSGVAYTSIGLADPWVRFARRVGVPYYAPDGDFVFRMNDGVNWRRYLRVVSPCVSLGSCPGRAWLASRRSARVGIGTRPR